MHAVERLYSQAHLSVLSQVALPSKFFEAVLALIWFFTCMCLSVFQIAICSKSFGTVLALVRF